MTGGKQRTLIPRVLLATPFRLSAIYVSIFCGIVALTFIYVYVNVQAFLTRDTIAAVQMDLDVLQDRFRRGQLSALEAAIADRSAPAGNALYLLTDGQGRRLAGNLDAVSSDLWNTEGPTTFSFRRTAGAESSEAPALGLVSRLPGNFRLIVARDVERQDRVRRLMRGAFFIGYGVIALVGFIGGVLMSRKILSRIDEASTTAHSIMNGNLAQRIRVTGRDDELDRLSLNLNAMLDRIQDLMTGLKDVSDNIAHDLKTPLHRLRTRAERALKSSQSPQDLAEALGAVIEEADALIQTFDALLNIARLEAGSRAESYGVLDICTLVRDVVDLYEPVGEEQGIPFHFSCAGNILIAGEKHLLGQAVANLLDNAIKYAASSRDGAQPEESDAEISPVEIGLEDKGESVDIVVADRGPGIPAKDRERVLQRFVRLQPSRSIPGSGLGLSLVAAVARLHGGSVMLEDNNPGLKVRVRLSKNLTSDQAGRAAAAPEMRAQPHAAI